MALPRATRLATASATPPDEVLELPYERRQISRQRVTLASGAEIGLFLPRGTVLHHGDRLAVEDGRMVQVRAAAEALSVVSADTSPLLARAAYHLGNRHVWVEIGSDCLYFLEDHVLDQMLMSLGLSVRHQNRPFEPEGGAYGDEGHGAHPHGPHHTHG